MASQRLVAAAVQALYPRAEAVAAAMPGADIRHTPGAAIEVKARRAFDPAAWMRQAEKNANVGELPIVVMRPDGAGEKSVNDWPAFIRLWDLIELLERAGYGE